MKYHEYGADQKETILLLHGGGLSWWNYRAAAELLQTEYHILLPILDGHAGSDRPFTTIEDNAAEILAFIDTHLDGGLRMIGGLSLGAQILLEMLSQRNDLCRYALVESAMVIPSGFTHAMIAPVFGSSYGLIKNRAFAKLQFRSLHMDPALFEEYYRDTCRIEKEDMIAFLKANTSYEPKPALQSCRTDIRIVVGGKEQKGILRSAQLLHTLLPESTLDIKDGLFHGEYSMNHPDRYAADLREMLRGRNRE